MDSLAQISDRLYAKSFETSQECEYSEHNNEYKLTGTMFVVNQVIMTAVDIAFSERFVKCLPLVDLTVNCYVNAMDIASSASYT